MAVTSFATTAMTWVETEAATRIDTVAKKVATEAATKSVTGTPNETVTLIESDTLTETGVALLIGIPNRVADEITQTTKMKIIASVTEVAEVGAMIGDLAQDLVQHPYLVVEAAVDQTRNPQSQSETLEPFS